MPCGAVPHNGGVTPPRIALATASEVPGLLDAEGTLLHAALRAAGADADAVVWDDPAADWVCYDAVVVRSTWDYAARRDEFVAWAYHVQGLTTLHNDAATIAWNTDKRYLRDLAAAGVPTVPTVFLDPGDDPARHRFAAIEHVVKPVVSAGSKDTLRFAPDQTARSSAHAGRLLDAGRPVMVQPYLSGVDTEGETAVVVIAGEVSHTLRKAPLLTLGMDLASGLYLPEEMSPRAATSAELAVARQALAAVPRTGGPRRSVSGEPLLREWVPREPLFARVDLLPTDDGPVVLELELTEPSLFLDHVPGTADRFAAAILARIR